MMCYSEKIYAAKHKKIGIFFPKILSSAIDYIIRLPVTQFGYAINNIEQPQVFFPERSGQRSQKLQELSEREYLYHVHQHCWQQGEENHSQLKTTD